MTEYQEVGWIQMDGYIICCHLYVTKVWPSPEQAQPVADQI